jgi:hypothetical protein
MAGMLIPTEKKISSMRSERSMKRVAKLRSTMDPPKIFHFHAMANPTNGAIGKQRKESSSLKFAKPGEEEF